MRKKQKTTTPSAAKVLKALELPGDVILGTPKITVTADREILIENYKGIIEYERSEIKINTEIGIITISGTELDISEITDDEIEVEGTISAIDFSR